MRAATRAPDRQRRLSAGVRTGLVVAAWLALLVPAAFYLAPRVVGLARLPETLDGAIGHIRAFTPRLPATAAIDDRATAELAALDRIDAALARVRGTDAAVVARLTTLVGQIRTEVQPSLDRTDLDVAALVGSLGELSGALEEVQSPLDDAATALRHDRARLDHALGIATSVAEQVRSARRSARRAADDVSGPR